MSLQKAKLLFVELVGNVPVERWEARLAELANGDEELRQSVNALLVAHREAPGFLESPVPALARPVDEPSNERPGIVIGPYKLIEQIGEGGMATVWMAQQTEPVKRLVAVKLIKAGMDSKQVLARFEAERQALALMDHPNIARVLDGGTTGAGRPYFVMDLVEGIPITEYCDEHHLAPRQRLELLIPVCHAIQHAHQKGLIHRDLKPSNVLVAFYDGNPVPKVIDFGVAKAVGQSLTDRTLVTGFGSIVGTLNYMSPEQADFNQLDVDTRSDVYSLGVLLYELLTGSPPHSQKETEAAGLIETLRVIREQVPAKPSTKLSTSAGLPTLAAKRGTEPAKLTRLMRGELDWIVMKALEKDRNRRYETANGFALDMQRYLADEPVLACPPSAGYRLQKFTRRNRGPMAAGATLAALLVLGTVGTSIGLVRALKAERRATAAAAVAEESEKDTQAFSQFLVQDVLSTARPEGWNGGQGVTTTVRRALDEAAAKLDERFEGKPRAEAVARHALGETYYTLGEHAVAEPLLRRAVQLRTQALGPEHPSTINSERFLGLVLRSLNRHEEAAALLYASWEKCRIVEGADSAACLHIMNALGMIHSEMNRHDQAIGILKDSLKRGREHFAADSPEVSSTMNLLGVAYQNAGRAAEALPLHEESLRIRTASVGAEHPRTLETVHNLALTLQEAGRPRDAVELFEKELNAAKATFGPEHRHTLNVMKDLGYAYTLAGRIGDAVATNGEAAKLTREKFGPDDHFTLASVHNLGVALTAARRPKEAIPLLQETLQRKQTILGPKHRETLKSMDALATAYRLDGKLKAATDLFTEELTLCRQVLGSEHSETLTCMNNCALAYQDAGRVPEAIVLYEELVRIRKPKLDRDNPRLLTSMHNLAWGYQGAGRLAEAATLYEEVLSHRRNKLGVDHPDTLATMYNLSTTYYRQGELDRAVSVYLDILAAQRTKFGPDSVQVAGTLAYLGGMQIKAKRFADAESTLRECLQITTKELPKHWRIAAAQSLLGAALVGQQKYAEAEPLLLNGFAGLKSQEKSLPTDAKGLLPTTVQQLVRLYETSGKMDAADEWRKKLEEQKK
jgi:serine/threonine protein kinase/tetratricopeptide (TPR) repeat protein